MIILIASDIHASPKHLSTVLSRAEEHKAGAIILNGDIVPKTLYWGMSAREALLAQRAYLTGTFLPEIEAFRKWHPAIRLFADFGNDDFWINRDVIIQAEQENLLITLHQRVQPIAPAIDIVGYMFVPPTPFSIKDAERIDRTGAPLGRDVTLKGIFSGPDGLREGVIDHRVTIDQDLQDIEKQIGRPFIFVSHSPPYGLGLDMTYDGRSVGSLAIRAFIERQADAGRLLAAFSGHIHESFEVSGRFATEINGRPIVNAGQMQDRLRYALYNLTTRRVTIKTSSLC